MRDLETALIFQAKETSYLFNCPDIFQRVANAQKIRFARVQYFFLPQLGPDQFSGFMGFYLSAREGVVDLESWQIVVFGPKGLKAMVKASTFHDDYFENVQLIEFPDNLEAPIPSLTEEVQDDMIVDEESKESRKIVSLEYIEDM